MPIGGFRLGRQISIYSMLSANMTGERKESNNREDKEGRLSVENLQRGDILKVEGGEEREEELG